MTFLYRKDYAGRQRHWTEYFINICIVVILFTLIVFIGLLIRNSTLINNELLTRAKSYVHHILITREWNAHFGGVYVEKKDGMESNPYLENPEIAGVDGKVYTMKNPALMTREISEMFEKNGLLSFRMTSLKPVNPANKPDKFETEALLSFEQGEKEFYDKTRTGGHTVFRYMVPLYVDEECLKCHARQGYKAGDLRGGISVSFDISDVEKNLQINRTVILTLGTVSTLTLLLIIYTFTFNLKKNLEKAHHKIREMAVTDELTGLYNRRHLFHKLNEEIKKAKRFGLDLGCIMLDIDFFKKINDSFGHQTGDIVLQNVAAALKDCCREIDTVARYGGEEFILLLPGTSLKGTLALADKIRKRVETLDTIYIKDTQIRVTVSQGAACFNPSDLDRFSDDEMLNLADKALYKAKMNGRNRTEAA